MIPLSKGDSKLIKTCAIKEILFEKRKHEKLKLKNLKDTIPRDGDQSSNDRFLMVIKNWDFLVLGITFQSNVLLCLLIIILTSIILILPCFKTMDFPLHKLIKTLIFILFMVVETYIGLFSLMGFITLISQQNLVFFISYIALLEMHISGILLVNF